MDLYITREEGPLRTLHVSGCLGLNAATLDENGLTGKTNQTFARVQWVS